MSSRKLTGFPDVDAKLQRPTMKSVFERQKAEAEAKRLREEKETAAVLKDFVKSFDHDDDDDEQRDNRGPPSRFGRPGGFGAPPPKAIGSGKRHFGMPASSLKSGPGSLGPAPSTSSWKRTADTPRDRDDVKGRLAFDDHEPLSISKAFDASDDEDEAGATGRAEEKAISKPTLRLANLPPATSPAVVRALIPSNLAVENIKMLPPNGPVGTDRKSTAAIVTLSKETAATDLDAAVSALQNRYLGFGFYLSLHRHLSSAAISAGLTTLAATSTTSHPFGAKAVPLPQGNEGFQHGGRGQGFAPPSSYGPPGGAIKRAGILHVAVEPPKDIKQLRMIHRVIEAILEHGPEFEALLMTRPDVQREEKWAWIWDARSTGGVWYRYRMWEIIAGSKSKGPKGRFLPLFEGNHAWKVPDQPLPFEYTTHVNEFLSDSEYNSSDDDDFDDEPTKPAEAGAKDQDDTFLNPMEKSKFVHLLARLPTTLSKLRKGDIARVAAFAITHANRGADEIVDMIVSNVEHPFSHSSANPEFKREAKGKEDAQPNSRGSSPGQEEKGAGEAQDTSAASLIGLYIVSDILSSSSTSGVRHAWRYRQLFEGALRSRNVFEGLGLLAEKLQWGRLRAEKWKRSVGLILGHWEGWCVFSAETQEFFVNSFENPPTLKKDEKVDENGTKKGKWKTVDAPMVKASEGSGFRPVSKDAAVVSTGPEEAASGASEAEDDPDVPYAEYTDDEDLDFECLDEEDLDGEPILESGMDGLSMEEDVEMDDGAHSPPKPELKSVGGLQMSSANVAPSRKRLRAVDMFADSDSEGRD